MSIDLSVTTATKYTLDDGFSTFDHDEATSHQRENGGAISLHAVETTLYTVGDRSTLDYEEATRWTRA